MPERPHNSVSKRVGEEAAEWLMSLRAGTMERAEQLKYVRWLKQSPAHVSALLELASLDDFLRGSDLNDRPASQGPSRPADALSVVVDLIPRATREKAPVEERRPSSPWRHWKFAASKCLSRVGIAKRAISRFVGISG